MRLEWRRIPTTTNWGLVDTETHQYVRQIAVRDPYSGEPDGTKFVVTGPGHEGSTHDTWEDAQAAAEASL